MKIEQKYEWVPIELTGGIVGLDLGFGQDTTSLCLLNRKGMQYFYKTFDVTDLLNTIQSGESLQWLDAECDVSENKIIDASGDTLLIY